MTCRCPKCRKAAKAKYSSAGHGKPAYSAHQSCRKSPKLLPEAEPMPTAQINSRLASFHGHSVSSSSPLPCLHQHVVFCLPTSVTAGCTGRWNTPRVQRVFVWFFGCWLFGFSLFTCRSGPPSQLAPPCCKQPKSVCCTDILTL